VESISKNKIKWVKSLSLKKNRQSERCFIIEGPKIIEEVIENWPDLIELICTSDNEYDFKNKVYYATPLQLKTMSSHKTAPTILAVVKFPEINPIKDGLTLAVDGIQDPGNMGTIIRTADWFGVNQIICSLNTVDIYNSKVIQSSMGSIFRMNIIYTDLVEFCRNTDKPTYGAQLDGEDMYRIDLDPKGILIIGNEGNGISPELAKHLKKTVLIPRIGEAESLNAAVATAVLLAEFKRPI
jgi:TrmH family RNA methyltransferase